MIDIFVSYSSKDRDTVKKLVEVMKSRGWSVWWDPTIRPGEYYEDVIEGALTVAKCVVVVWSKNSVASKWVRAEAAEAANRGVLVPVVIDAAKIPFRFKQIQEANLSDWQFTPDHPGLVSLLESIAEKFIKAQEAQDAQGASETPKAAQPTKDDDDFTDDEYQEDYSEADSADASAVSDEEEINQEAESDEPGATGSSSLTADDDSAFVDSLPRRKAKAPQPERARRARPFPVKRKIVEDSTTVEQDDRKLDATRRKQLVTVALIAVGIMVVGGAIYAFTSRESATTNNQANREIAQQNSAPVQPSNISNASIGNALTATPTPAPSASPSPTPTPTPAVSAAEIRKLEGLLTGKWQSQNAPPDRCECDNSYCLNIQLNKTISDFCLQSNQVYVDARFALDAADKKAYLYFNKPGSDLGAGGGRMPWDKFDRTKPLATIDLSDMEEQRLIYVTWHGFTERGTARQRWRTIGSGFQGTYMKQ